MPKSYLFSNECQLSRLSESLVLKNMVRHSSRELVLATAPKMVFRNHLSMKPPEERLKLAISVRIATVVVVTLDFGFFCGCSLIADRRIYKKL